MLTDEELIQWLRTELAPLRPSADLLQRLREQAAAADGDRHTRRPSRRHRRLRAPAGAVTVAASSLVVIAVVVGALFLAGGHSQPPGASTRLQHPNTPGTSHHRPTSRHVPASRAVDPAVVSLLSVFARARTSADTLPSSLTGAPLSGYPSAGLDVADARHVTASDGQTAFLIPSRGGVCVINTNEAFCTTPVRLPGAAVADLCSPTLPAGKFEIEWLLPDRATHVALGMTDGTTARFPAGFNVYIARLPLKRPLPATIDWDDATGAHHSVTTPIPTNSPIQGCAHPHPATPPKAITKPSAA